MIVFLACFYRWAFRFHPRNHFLRFFGIDSFNAAKKKKKLKVFEFEKFLLSVNDGCLKFLNLIFFMIKVNLLEIFLFKCSWFCILLFLYFKWYLINHFDLLYFSQYFRLFSIFLFIYPSPPPPFLNFCLLSWTLFASFFCILFRIVWVE